MKIHLCAIAKNEYKYIKDWVKYNLAIGFDKIVIYDNNNINGERYDELLKEFIDTGTVEIRDRRGQSGQQCKVYNEYYKEGDFDWLGIVDIDEFITFGPYTKIKTVHDFIENYPDADSISIYWQCYGDCDNVMDSDKPIFERFKEPLPIDVKHRNHTYPLNTWPKSFHKKGLDITLCEHFISLVHSGNVKHVDVLGENFNFKPSVEYIAKTYDIACIRHYMTKSLDEWYKCKLKRGHADSELGENNSDAIDYSSNIYGWNYGFDSFFNYNKYNDEKVDYLHSLGYNIKVEFKPVMLVNIFFDNKEVIDKLWPYIEKIQDVCIPKFIYYCNQANGLEHIDLFSVYSDTKICYADYDLIGLKLLCYDNYSLNTDKQINGFINIGYPIDNSESYIDEYFKQLDNLFGNKEALQYNLQQCIHNGYTIVDKDSLRQVFNIRRNCPGLNEHIDKFVDYYGGGDAQWYINNNTFITPFDQFWSKVGNKELIYEPEPNNEIKAYLKDNILSMYHALQCAYPVIFNDKFLKI